MTSKPALDPADIAATLDVLGRLRVVRLRFLARAIDAVLLGEFQGSAIRGGLQVALFDVGCVAAHRHCPECAFLENCAVPQILGREMEGGPGGGSFFTRPYRIVVPALASSFEPGDTFEFGVDLFGPATEFAPLVAAAVERLAERGLGRRRGRFVVERTLDGTTAPTPTMRARLESRLLELPTDRLRILFDSPLRLLAGGRTRREFSFPSLVASLLRRASGLMESERARIEVVARPLQDRAALVVPVAVSWIKRDQVRFSSRQGRTMNLHGTQGEVEVAGDLACFLPWLAFGEIAGVGKGTTFGHGSMRLLAPRALCDDSNESGATV